MKPGNVSLPESPIFLNKLCAVAYMPMQHVHEYTPACI